MVRFESPYFVFFAFWPKKLKKIGHVHKKQNGEKCAVKEKTVHLLNSMTTRLSLKKQLSELYVRAFWTT